jgi:hypothetical protein
MCWMVPVGGYSGNFFITVGGGGNWCDQWAGALVIQGRRGVHTVRRDQDGAGQVGLTSVKTPSG